MRAKHSEIFARKQLEMKELDPYHEIVRFDHTKWNHLFRKTFGTAGKELFQITMQVSSSKILTFLS